MKATHFLFLIVILLIYTNCTSTKVTSKVMSENYEHQVSDIFYAVNFPKKMEKTVPYLVDETKTIYSLNNFKFGYEQYTFFSTKESYSFKEIVKTAKASEFNYLLMIKETDHDRSDSYSMGHWGANGTYTGGGSTKSITHGLEAYLYSVSDTTEIWRAKIEVKSGDYGNSAQSGRSLAKGIIKKLRDDQILKKNFILP